jgi:hypothetical protein
VCRVRRFGGLAVYTDVMREQPRPEAPPGPDECYVSVPVTYDGRGDHDESGTLYVTNEKIVFVGESVTDAPWSKITRLSRDGIKLLAFRHDRPAPLVFSCASLFDSVRVAYVAERCLHPAKF